MAAGALAIASNFAGGAAEGIDTAQKLRLEQLKSDREDQELKLKQAAEGRNVEQFGWARKENERHNQMLDELNVPEYSAAPGATVSPTNPAAPAPSYTEVAPAKGGVASVRSNNPGAMWPNPIASRFGATSYQSLNDGTGQGNKIAIFPDAESGAAAHFALLNEKYTGMPLSAAITKWSGGNSSPQYTALVSKATGIAPGEVLTPQVLASPRGIALTKAMARQEAGGEFPLSDEGWARAQSRAFGGKTAAADTGTATDAALPSAPAASDGGPKFISPSGAPTSPDGTPATTALPTDAAAPATATPTAKYVKVMQPDGTVGYADASKTQSRSPADIAMHRALVVGKYDPVAGQKMLEGAQKIATDQIDLTVKKYGQSVAEARRVAQTDPQRGLAMLTQAYSQDHPDAITPTFQFNKDGTIGAAYSINTAAGPVITKSEIFKPTEDGRPALDAVFDKASALGTPDQMRQRLLDDSKLATDFLSRQVERSKAEIAKETAPYAIEEMKGKPALQAAQTANFAAEAEYRKNQMLHDQLQLKAQARMKAAEDVNKLRINGILDPDPLKAAKQIGDIYTQYGLDADDRLDFTGKGGATKPAPGAGGALPGTTTGPNPYAAPSPTPAAPAVAASKAAATALPTPGAPAAAPSGPPAPIDDSPLGAIGRGVHSIIQSQKQSYQQTARDHADAAWEGEAGQSYAKVNYAYYKNQAPNASDVNALGRSLKSWPWLADKMDPNVVKYVKEHTK
jgi:hypothetical protein